MKVIICGSISAADEMFAAQKALESRGCAVEIPESLKRPELQGRTNVSVQEKAEDKIKYDLIKGYYEKIKQHDALLVVNPEKRGISGYIGGNTLIEMAFGHVLGKRIFVLHPLPNMPYSAEILATQPILLEGDVTKML